MTVGGPSLVGRAREIAALRDRLDRAAAGRGTAVLVTGEAGIGKSRLAREMSAQATDRGWSVVEGRCVAVGSEPLRRAALLDMLRSPAVGGGANGGGLATASTEELLERVLALVDAASPARPLLLLVEDLHWADRATCEVVMVLARHVAGRPACLVTTSRDDELPRGHHVRGFLAELRRAQLVTTLALHRLGAAEVATLLQNLAGPVEPARASAIFERSGGNPLLVEELCEAAAGPAELEDRFVDVLLARTDGLSALAMTVAGAVAAAGRFVDEALLADVVTALPAPGAPGAARGSEGSDGSDDDRVGSPSSDDPFAAGLREALDHHLLVRHDGAVGFRHVLVAEAVHGQMLFAERVAVHARWADVLGRRGEDPAVLAHHWAEARDAERALAASIAAGDTALLALAPHESMAHYRRALSLWDEVPDAATVAGRRRNDLCSGAAAAANWAGRPGEAVELVTLALDALNDLDEFDAVDTSRLLERKGWYLLRQGRTDAAREPYRAAVAGLPSTAPAPDRARVLAGSVRIWERRREFDRALATARLALAAACEPGATDADEGPARYMLGRALLGAGHTEAALAELGAAAASAERRLDTVALSITLLDRADVLATLERLGEALDEALAVADRLRARGHVDPDALLCVGAAAAILHRMGRIEEARPLVDGLVAEARTPVTLAVGHLLTGVLDLDARALGDAREHLEMARFLAAPMLDGRIAGNLAWGRAELALAEGRLDDARAAVDEGIGQVECTGDEEVLADLCLLGLRIAADRAAQADPRRSERAKARDAAAVARYERRLGPLASEPEALSPLVAAVVEAEPLAGTGPLADAPAGHRTGLVARAVGAAWRAERTRLDGASDAAAWAEATERWVAIGRPRLAVLARIRRAEALQAHADCRPEVPSVLERAVKEAEAVGSRLLADHARTVARRAGITLPGAGLVTGAGAGAGLADPDGPGRGAAPADDDRGRLASLTRREREVLDLVATGATNRQIGAALYISTKTASVHVSRILTKLGVVSRGEAAEIVHRAS
jgi:DNA-binding NarL/FixJ family response regulator/tetratricopeptide (TPR) repeat protein